MLTRKQHELLLYIHKHLGEHGVSPSFDEMKEALNLKSKSGIHRLISGLEERGFIRRLPHRARALEVLRLPGEPSTQTGSAEDGAQDAAGHPLSGAHGRPVGDNVVQANFRAPTVPELGATTASQNLHLPLYGRIAAGTPIEALRDESAFVEIPGAMVGDGEHYCLEVDGDSMIEAGIHDGDTVVIRRGEHAEPGAIVVALVDGEEATLKRIRRRGHSIALEPANPAYETRIYPPERVKVQGRLVALLRRYH
ncbi:transcriptional repressor LexA [Rhodovibrio salinarum]|uniref:LexA repressor n=1 Tax=Rhodovibrio salinarum TaxID=1087 RepID=A0A934V0T1_9PROT|nr:transcriptional repressor LexA [Rhodovibrio salinarum]MBK1697825.1 transcriptional repressor LexA [Rhodovibrio salinarum]